MKSTLSKAVFSIGPALIASSLAAATLIDFSGNADKLEVDPGAWSRGGRQVENGDDVLGQHAAAKRVERDGFVCGGRASARRQTGLGGIEVEHGQVSVRAR